MVTVAAKKTVNRVALGVMIAGLIVYVVTGGVGAGAIVATVSEIVGAIMVAIRETLN